MTSKKTATLRWLYQVLGRTSLGDLNPVAGHRLTVGATLVILAPASILLSVETSAGLQGARQEADLREIRRVLRAE
jgi:hypothetical protein